MLFVVSFMFWGEDLKVEIKVEKPNIDKPEEKVVKVKRPLQTWKSYPSGSQRERSFRTSRKWSKAPDADVLEIDGKPLPKLNEDEEAIGIITMEDVIEELLQVSLLVSHFTFQRFFASHELIMPFHECRKRSLMRPISMRISRTVYSCSFTFSD